MYYIRTYSLNGAFWLLFVIHEGELSRIKNDAIVLLSSYITEISLETPQEQSISFYMYRRKLYICNKFLGS